MSAFPLTRAYSTSFIREDSPPKTLGRTFSVSDFSKHRQRRHSIHQEWPWPTQIYHYAPRPPTYDQHKNWYDRYLESTTYWQNRYGQWPHYSPAYRSNYWLRYKSHWNERYLWHYNRRYLNPAYKEFLHRETLRPSQVLWFSSYYMSR